MTVAIKKQLDERLRDALLALYLNKVVPVDATTKNLKLKTAQDLYEYWLLDVLVSQDVPTTPVACAIASLQHYINRILMNMEPGYDSATDAPEHVQTWRNEMHQYPTWAAHQKLLYFPAIYLDPGLRNNKSDNFQQLENDLSQNRIQPDAVQTAVLAYLTRFEEVANLNILNGYIEGADFANSTYYFIAKSRSENTYFWRSLNMAQRPQKTDQPDPFAWSDWEKADVPIPDDAIEHSIRPVWFNNRLFVVWAECIHQDPAAHSSESQTTRNNPLFRLSLSYRKHDGSWSTARTCLQGYGDDVTLQDKDLSSIKSLTGTVAVHHQEHSQDCLLIGLFVKQHDMANNGFIFLKTASFDKNLTHSPGIFISKKAAEEDQQHPHYILTRDFFTFHNKSSLQLKISIQAKLGARKTLEKLSTSAELKDKNVKPLDGGFALTVDINYDSSTTKITLRFRSIGTLDIGREPGSSFNYVVRRPETTVSPTESTSNNSGTATIPKDYTFSFHTQRFSESGENFHYGYCITNKEHQKEYFLASIKLRLGNNFRTPDIRHSDKAQFLDFSGATISLSESGLSARQPIRLNTVFAAEMIQRTENSLDKLFSMETQRLPEPKIADTDFGTTMDFHGPYGRYFTELFLYLPWLIAHRLNTEHQYDEAERWIRYAFDPGRKQSGYWNAVPLTGPDVPSYSSQAPHDPHQIALSHPVHFRKTLYFLYLDILINRGDAAYRELTPDSLGEAKRWYVRALDLLGPRPVVQQVDQWSAISLQALSKAPSKSLRTFEDSLIRSNLQLREGSPQKSLPAIDTPHLRLPFNPELLKRWDIAESRLYNLRHNLDIVGKPLHLPLFAAPLDPRALLSANALSASSGGASNLPSTQIPHYRFTVMHSQALSAVESVNQFGATLLSLIERKEQTRLQELQQQHAWDLAKMSVGLQTQALRIDRQNRQALLASKAIVRGRISHYQQLLEKDVTQEEAAASQLYLSSGASELAASASQVVAGGMMMVPNIFGFSNGGSRWEGGMHAATALAQGCAIATRTAASHLDRTAQFSRRREEWTLTRDQAQLELDQIDAQLAHFTEQETATRLQLRQTETALSQTKASYDFLSKRFTKAQLYQWLNSQFATLYYQAYDATLALCLAAEACWQYERADFSTRFIQPGTWNTTYRGLGAGEQLKLSLLKMQAEYLQRNERELEIRKTVSLRQIKDKDSSSSINKEWKDLQIDLKDGICDFELTHAMFEDDYKAQKHYLRRIKTLSVSLPALLGPYENIRATLTQTASKVFMSPGDQGQLMENKRASQQIALSTGVDDNGLFTLNFNDERYLPFEYTGAISTWRLTFPNPEAQKAMLDSLTDIIVHVSYTARAGGA
ncbi:MULTISPECIES: neuraminidase-like domain-containing protein [unclassified Pseudomonas]|uniref:Tc toxin subunit A-related protein n=1 Tax=unclassified Pseudomonas TaxID=196821 RepID=UPI002114C5A8|nr:MULTISPECIES: neuraminidase-like domain-containing protein [unclassified Pseudomonas]